MYISFKTAGKRLLKRLEPYAKTDLSYFTKSSFWLNLTSIFGAFLSFLLSILFAHYVSKDTYGTYRFILSVAGLASAFSLTGMNVAVMRSVAQGFDGIFKRAMFEQIKWSWPQFLFSFVAGLYYFFYGNTVFGIAFFIVSILAPISTVSNTYAAILIGKKDFRTSSWYSIYSNLVYFIGLASVIIGAPSSVILMILGYYFLNTGANVYFCLRTYRKYNQNLSTNDYRTEDITYAKHLSLMNTVSILATQADSILVYYLLGPVSLALYSFATLLPERIRTMFGFIGSAAFPKIAERNFESMRPTANRKIWQLIILALLISVIYIILAPTFFRWFYPQYQNVVIYSQIFSLSLVAIATNISLTALQAHRKQKELYIISFGVPIAKIALSAAGIFYLGIWGAIIAKMTHHILLLVLSSFYLRKKS